MSLDSLVTNNDTINQIFSDFNVVSYQVSFPGAKSEILKKVFEVHLDGDPSGLRDTLLTLPFFNDVQLCDYYQPASCTDPIPTNDPYDATPPIGQGGSLINTDQHLVLLDAYCAWTITKGSPDIIVGVVDTEFDINHEDLEGQILSVFQENSVHAHGTSVTGCVAAIPNNNVGIAGIGYHTKVRGYATQGYNPVVAGQDEVNIWPLIWQAYLDDVNVINVSWIGIGNDYTIESVQEITESGIVITTAAGNNPNAEYHSEYADIPGVINVSGVDADNFHGPTNLAHNQWVDVCVMTKDMSMLLPSNNYATGGATSQAAPQVAGLAALILSVKPCFTAGEVETIIKQSADPIADEDDFPGLLGAGRANAYQALLLAVNNAGCEIHEPIDEPIIWDTPRCVYGDLIIESGASLTITNEVTFSPGAKVTVQPGATIIIDGGHLMSADFCESKEFWQGIEVLGTPNQPQLPQYQGRVIMRNGGTIEHAVLGVSLGIKNADGTPDLSTTGGYLICSTGATFLNCQQAVQAYDYTGAFTNKTKFYNTTFEINDDWLFEEEIPWYQVVLRGVNNIKFQGCDFVNNRTGEFSILDAGKGIAASNSGFHVTNCHFENLELGIAVKSLGFDDIKISENTFTGNLGGVSLRYSGLAEIVENDFNIPGISDLNIHPSNVAYGIYIGGSTGYEVEENVFIGDDRDQNVGVAVQSSGPEHNEIYKNSFKNLAVGIVAMGDNRGSGLNLGLEFLCDSLGTFDQPLNYSIALTNEGEVQHYQGVQGVSGGGAGNLFYPLCAPFSQDREFNVGDDTPIDSPVNYIPFAEDFTRPDCNTEAMVTVALSDDPFNYNQHCPSNQSSGGVLGAHIGKYQLNQGILSGLYDVYDNTVNGGDTEFLLDLIEDPFVSSFDLRNELLLSSPRVTDEVMIAAIRRDPEMNPWHLAQVLLANSPLTQRVLNVLNDSDVNIYYKELVEDGQNGGMTNTTLMEMELSHFSGKMQNARADYLRQAYRQDSTMALNDSIVHYLSDDASDDGLKMLLSYHIKRHQWQEAQDLLDDAPNMRWHSDYAEAMGILVEALQDSSGADAHITSNETALLAIANDTHREAYLARAILESYGLAEFEYPIVLPEPSQKSMKQDKDKNRGTLNPMASIHPNPAKNTVYLSWRFPEEISAENVMLSVYNSQGVMVRSQRLNGQVGIEEINLSTWASGLYIYQLRHDEILLHSEKFEVLR